MENLEQQLAQRRARLNALENQVVRLSRRLAQMTALSEQYTRWRLFAFLSGAVAVFFGLAVSNVVGGFVLAVWAIGFGVLVSYHRRVLTEIDRFKIWRILKTTQIARMRLEWDALPPESATMPPNHPFALDVDIIGQYSVHRLLDTTLSRPGSERLKDWLLHGAPNMQDIQRRQGLVRELIPLWMFRDRMALAARMVLGEQVKAQVDIPKSDSDGLLRWLRATNDESSVNISVLMALGALSAVNIVLFLLNAAGVLPAYWIAPFVVYLALSGSQWSRLAGLFSETLTIQAQIRRLSAVFNHLETYPYKDSTQLKALCRPFVENKPSQALRRIGWITAAASIQRNPVLWIILNLAVPWDVFFAYQLERSKGDLAQTLPRWLDVWYELEALNALATLGYLNPHYTFPVIHADTVRMQTVFNGQQLGHPLIHTEDKIRNDFALDNLGQVVIITGSNMSGKSSFLRTLGVNLTLAYAGGVVDAAHLESGLFRLFTSIRVTDSVVDGFSYFYAEVRRLKALLEALHDDNPMPLFFLIDEIFRGTNNRERFIGSWSYIQALAGGNGIGLVATHDLELVKLENVIAAASNYHFREEVIDGRMAFDYKLRSGPSPTTNALTIMKLEGLPVQNEDIIARIKDQ